MVHQIDPQSLFDLDEHKWEHSIVQALCVKLGLSTSLRGEMRAHARSQGGPPGGQLTFGGFHAAVPDFPIIFGCKLIRNLHAKVSVATLFRDFLKTPIVYAYTDLQEELGRDVGLGMVFRWPRLGKQGGPPEAMVLCDRMPQHDRPGIRATWYAGGKKLPPKLQELPRRLTMCSLTTLVDDILVDDWPL